MLIENRNFPEKSSYRTIETAPEEPIQPKEWALVAVGITALALLIAPIWAAAGLICLGPALLIKKYAPHFSEQNQRRFNKFFAYISEIFLLIEVGLKSALTALHIIPLEKVKEGGRPILLVHGFLNNPAAWTHYLDVFPKKDLGSVYTINLGHPFLPLSEYAQKVKEKAEEIRKQTGRSDLILIGHSMGGVVCALYAAKLAKEGTVTDLFTIGSPLSGCPMAKIASLGPNTREMRPGAPLLSEIRQGLEAKKQAIRFYHIGSDSDTLVPADSALSGCGKKLRVPDLSHSELLSSKIVSDWISTQIQNN